MRHRAKSPLTLLVTLGLALTGPVLVPTLAQAAAPLSMAGLTSINTPGLFDLSTANQPTVTIDVAGVALTGTAGSLSVALADQVTLTLFNASITGNATGSPIDAGACAQSCTLVLIGTNTAEAMGARVAGVHVPTAASLTIEGPGSLTATGYYGGAGIGSNYRESSGSIAINNAVINATGDNGGAGIGGGAVQELGHSITQGPIVIENSAVTATGSSGALSVAGYIGYGGGGAGIGGGGGGSGSGAMKGGDAGAVTIITSGVMATGGVGSYRSDAGPTASGGAGIGGGGGGWSYGYGGSAITVTIDATSAVQTVGGAGGQSPSPGDGGGGGAAVGSGGGGFGSATAVGSITIVGATLADGSAGGLGGIGNPGAITPTQGGTGALCGTGGSSTSPPAEGIEATVDGSAYCGTSPNAVDLADWPVTAGLPGPAMTDPSPATVANGANASITVAPTTHTHLFGWQISTDNGASWSDLVDGGIYLGTTTDTLALTGVVMAMSGNQYRCLVGNAVVQGVASGDAMLTVLEPVTFTAKQVGGSSGTADSTGIELTFSKPVTGLTAGHIHVTNGSGPVAAAGQPQASGTGQVTVGALSEASSTGTNTTWTIALTAVARQGYVKVEVANFGIFLVTSAPQQVTVFAYDGAAQPTFQVTLNQATGGKATASLPKATAGTAIALAAVPNPGYRFDHWLVSPSVTWTSGVANAATASFTMPASDVMVTPVFTPVLVMLPVTGDASDTGAAGLALLTSLFGMYALAWWRRRLQLRGTW